jgi:hypothetical protein
VVYRVPTAGTHQVRVFATIAPDTVGSFELDDAVLIVQE